MPNKNNIIWRNIFKYACNCQFKIRNNIYARTRAQKFKWLRRYTSEYMYVQYVG
jgi:hypothetical protein